ncbi:hypothetical protein EC988_003898 [Linderina pennispora]|nr:hypothetical protein EC988_003898 [Linderina pennispora]
MSVQPRTSTLKSFVRVSKTRDAAAGKGETKLAPVQSPRRMTTRSRTAKTPDIVVETPARKRKPTEALPDSPVRKRKTTIGQYFPTAKSPRKQTVKKTQPVRTQAEESNKDESNKDESIKDESNMVTAQEQVEETAGPKKSLNTRAQALLARLHSRPAIAEKPGARLAETREIQEELRMRRMPGAVSEPALAASSFETVTDKGSEVKQMARGFVMQPARRLPRELRKLNELFQGLEHAVLFQNARSVVYHRVRKAVESMARRTFGWRELGQVMRVFPEAYSYEPVEIAHDGRKVTSVVLTPNVTGAMQAVEMEQRRNEFHARLMERVAEAHRLFLVSRGFASEPSGSGLHREFDIETVPAVVPVALPPVQQPCQKGMAAFSKDRLKHLLASAKSQPADRLQPTGPEPTQKPAEEKPVVRAQSLLERIRAKQMAKEQAASAEVPAATRTMHGRLPALVESLSFLFYAERHTVLPFYYVVEKLAEAKGLDRAEVVQHVTALCGFLPQWCKVVNGGEGESPQPKADLKITRTCSVQEAVRAVEAKIKEAERERDC